MKRFLTKTTSRPSPSCSRVCASSRSVNSRPWAGAHRRLFVAGHRDGRRRGGRRRLLGTRRRTLNAGAAREATKRWRQKAPRRKPRPRASTAAHRRIDFRAPPQLPDDFPATTRYVFFGGKGGVGKTTAASAAALALLERPSAGERILLFSTDPAHSLGDSLDVEVGDRTTEVARRGRDDGAAALRTRDGRHRRARRVQAEASRDARRDRGSRHACSTRRTSTTCSTFRSPAWTR